MIRSRQCYPFLGVELKWALFVFWSFLEIDFCSATSMESSRQDLLKYMAEHGSIFKNYQITNYFYCNCAAPKKVRLPLNRGCVFTMEVCKYFPKCAYFVIIPGPIAYSYMNFRKSTVIHMDIRDFWMSVFKFPYKCGYPHWYPSKDIHARTLFNGCPWNMNIYEWTYMFLRISVFKYPCWNDPTWDVTHTWQTLLLVISSERR